MTDANIEPDPNFKWTPQDNKMAKLEMKLAARLTKELNERPSIALRMLLVSEQVKKSIAPILYEMKIVLGHDVVFKAYSNWEGEGKDRKRKVSVFVI